MSALQGWHFNMAICDEVHVYKDESVWEAVVSGQGRIPNALALAITTASAGRTGFLWDWYSRIRSEGEDGCYCYWVGLDDSDRADDRRAWRKLMVTPRINMEQLEAQRAAMTAKSFERYQLNRFPMEKEEEPFMRRRDVSACSKASGTVDRDRWFAVGLDGAVSGDTLAVVAAQQGDDGIWAFEEWVWDVTGQMGVYDLTDVADVLETLARTRGRPLVVCDPARLQFTVNWLNNNRGIELFKMPQTGAVMCPASELLASAVRLGPAFVLPHLRPKGQERQLGHLEELHAEGRPHHGDAPDGPQEQVAEGHLGATEDEPEAVGQARRQATPVDDLLAEGREGERGHLEGLPPHGDAHDRKAPHEAYEQPGQGGDPPAGDDPYNVSQGAHGSSS